jgi:thioredoxin 1
MLPLIIKILIGAGIGAAIARFGKCSGGACPLTSTWISGAFFGGLAGLALGLMTSSDPSMNQSTSSVKHVTAKDFDSEVNQDTMPVVVDFYATWCGPCKAMMPNVDSVAAAYQARVRFLKVNVDESPEIASRYNISGIPALVFLKNGKVVDSSMGYMNAEALQARVDALLASQ